ncbi:NrdH-redoxin [bacterium]|nr:NrdH-redoxin [bacterium]NIN92744.1 NrdH-redoxin [bacterium]NIO18725.1 NrdH-redoxin [bacterium]NIO73801.1 NrdH-redoxin [bacterium]
MENRKVTIYSTPSCPFCMMAKSFMKENNIDFEDIDVSADHTKVQEMVQKSGQMAVPVIDIDGEIIVGFDKDKIRKALGL